MFVFGFEGWIIFGLEDIFADRIFVFIIFGPRVYKGYMCTAAGDHNKILYITTVVELG